MLLCLDNRHSSTRQADVERQLAQLYGVPGLTSHVRISYRKDDVRLVTALAAVEKPPADQQGAGSIP